MRQVISTLGEGKMYYTAKLHPNTDKQNMLFAGCADKKVYQWDANSGDLVQVRACPPDSASNAVALFAAGAKSCDPSLKDARFSRPRHC